MKTKFLLSVATLLVVALCSHAIISQSKRTTLLAPSGFYVYQSGAELNLSNYSYSTAEPSCPGDGPNLCAVYIPSTADINADGNITQTEFYNFLVNYDYDAKISDHLESTVVRKRF